MDAHIRHIYLSSLTVKVDKTTQRVFLTRVLVEDALSTTPPVIKLYDRSGTKEYIVGQDEVHFDPGSAAVTILDRDTQKQRKAITKDLVDFVRLTDHLPHIDFQSTGLISTDIPDMISDSYRLYIGLQFSDKPIVTGTFRVEGLSESSAVTGLVKQPCLK